MKKLIRFLFISILAVSITSGCNKKEPNTPEITDTVKSEETKPEISVSAYLIYRTGKLSEFDVLNDDVALWNTIIGAGSAEDWSEQTKIILKGKAKNIDIRIANGDIVVIEKKNFNLTGMEEFIINDTGCLYVTIQILSEGKEIYRGLIEFECGE